MHKVGVVGAGGRMGREVCLTVAAAPDLELVAAVDPFHDGEVIEGLTIGGDVAALAHAGAEVVVDFSVADAVRANLAYYAGHGIHAVIGTTGLSEADLEAASELFEEGAANAVVAANFAIGAVLLMRFCELAAPHMDGVEVIELHHDASATHLRERRGTRRPSWRKPALRRGRGHFPRTRRPSSCCPGPEAPRALAASTSIRCASPG